MTKHRSQRLSPNLINHNVLANNGQVPGAALWRRLAQAHNHAANWRPDYWLMISDDLRAIAAGSASTVETAYSAGVTGHGTHSLVALVGLGRPDDASASDPFARVKYRAQGDPLESTAGEVHYHGGDKTSLVPADVHHGSIEWSVNPNTHYSVFLQLHDYSRLFYFCVVEKVTQGVDDTDRGIVDPTQFVGDGDIEDAAIQDLVDSSNDLVRHNRTHLLAYTRPDTAFPTTTSSSYENIMSDAIWQLDLSNHDYENGRGVPVVFGVRVVSGPVDSGCVRLRNTTDGTTIAEITNAVETNAKWISTSARITPSDIDGDDLEIQFKSDGTNSFEVRGVTLYEYEYDWSTALSNSADLEASSSQYLKITDANQNGVLDVRTNLTIECWVNFESTPSSGNAMYLVAKWDQPGNERAYQLILFNDSGTLKLIAGVSDDGSNGHQAEADWTPSTDTWYQVAMTFDPQASGGTPADQFEIYVDGSGQTVSTRNDDSAVSIDNNSAEVSIGSAHGGDNFLDGQICDVRIWREVRTSSEISDNHDRDIQLHAGLVGHWIKSDLTTDETDHSNDLIEVNSPTSVVSGLPY